MKTKHILYPLCLATAFSIGIYLLFFNATPTNQPSKINLSLIPKTIHEQNDLILKEQQDNETITQTGPLLQQTSAADAQQKVLNLTKQL